MVANYYIWRGTKTDREASEEFSVDEKLEEDRCIVTFPGMTGSWVTIPASHASLTECLLTALKAHHLPQREEGS